MRVWFGIYSITTCNKKTKIIRCHYPTCTDQKKPMKGLLLENYKLEGKPQMLIYIVC